jgi:hypothetical protein
MLTAPFGALNIEEDIIEETDEEIDARLKERFSVLKDLTLCILDGDSRALVVSGPTGLGKSYTIEQLLKNKDESEYRVVRGFVRATGLYRLLYEMKSKESVIVIDDADSIFFDDVSLNLIKAACDTTDRRRISWRAETKMRDEEDEPMPTTFDFEGSIIFITNYDFDKMISAGHKLSEHLAAMVSRAHYIDLTLKSKRDFIIRIHQVIKEGMLSDRLTKKQIDECLEFIEANSGKLRELSLRMAIKIAKIMKTHPTRWEKIARITCCKQ